MTQSQTRVFWFFIATFGFSWIGNLGNWLLPSPAWPTPLNPVGPLLAALLVIALTDGRNGLRKWWAVWKNFRAPVWLYMVALIGPPSIHLVSLGLASLSGIPLGPLPEREWTDFLVLIPIVLVAGPLLEETAFLGYAQLQLEKDLTTLTSALLIGLGILVWHLPMFLAWSPIGQISGLFFIFAVTIVYVWMLKTGGSIWPPLLAHASLNYFGERYLGGMLLESADLFFYYSYITTIVLFIASVLVWIHGWRLATTKHLPDTESVVRNR